MNPQGVKMEPQQELFTALRMALSEDYDVYDGKMPPADTPYPFVYLGHSQFIDSYGNKSLVLGTCYQTIDVWHDDVKKRGDFSAILADVKSKCRAITATPTYGWSIANITQDIEDDDTTHTPLLRGTLQVEFTLLGG